jgi:hypothetical protein
MAMMTTTMAIVVALLLEATLLTFLAKTTAEITSVRNVKAIATVIVSVRAD